MWAYKKNDQAWVEQKNGAIVRRLVGYGRLSGSEATKTLARLYASSRLYINFFQPSFKLKSKTREGARVKKVYHAPATPCERLVAHPAVDPTIKEKLATQFQALDPVRLLQEIRIAQQSLSDIATYGPPTQPAAPAPVAIDAFLSSLSSAWKEGEVRPTHRRKTNGPRWWRTHENPFAQAWPVIEGWLSAEPSTSANELMDRLAAMIPEVYGSKAQLRTLQRRVREWRSERAKEMVLGRMRKAGAKTVEHQLPGDWHSRFAEGGRALRARQGYGHMGDAPGGAPAATVDNAPLRSCVAHRRRLRPHAHSPRQRMKLKKNRRPRTTNHRVTFLREATRRSG